MIFFVRRAALGAALILIAMLTSLLPASGVLAGDREDAIEILDRWTAIRWGEDSIVWVVHYPEELVEPWVAAEAEKRRLRPDEAAAFRRSFMDDLRIGSTTPVMLSIHSFGGVPLNLSPLAKNIALIDSSGARISPVVVEKKLDGPLSGLVQGFVFFPRQEDENFRIALRGIVPNQETIFSFGGAGGINTAEVPETRRGGAPRAGGESGEVVVKIPTTREPPRSTEPAPPVDEPEFSTEGEVYEPTAPPTPPPVPEPEPEPEIDLSDLLPGSSDGLPVPAQDSRGALDAFLKAWIAGDSDAMYSMLSEKSRERISRELFERDVMSGGFRSALRSGYKVNWVGDGARVTVARKMLFIRTMETKHIDFVMENGAARVVW
ncbi:MAG: hypothetical protein LBQ56_06265 [Synergistaceae bacterium]|jgi:hypothetical protein|nr:hypothetical protein [Synergistaceae bacterium]